MSESQSHDELGKLAHAPSLLASGIAYGHGMSESKSHDELDRLAHVLILRVTCLIR